MLAHVFTHCTTPVQALIFILAFWKSVDIALYLRNKHEENKK